MRRTYTLKTQILQAPFTFEFAQAVHLLYDQTRNKGTEGSKTLPVFFKGTPTFSPSSSDIVKIKEMPFFGRQKTGTPKALHVYTNFFGLTGAHGPLPNAYTERILQQGQMQGYVFSDFLDLFNHRLLEVFFHIKKKYFPVLGWNPPESSVLGTILSNLTGGDEKFYENFPKRSALQFARIFWKKPHTPEGLARLLAAHFHISVRVLTLQGAWLPIQRKHCTKLGRARALLGDTFVLGKRTWSQDHRVEIQCTLPSHLDLQSFFPKQTNFERTRHLATLYTGTSVQLTLTFIKTVTKTKPLGQKHNPFRLGWTSWVLGQKKAHRAQLSIHCDSL